MREARLKLVLQRQTKELQKLSTTPSPRRKSYRVQSNGKHIVVKQFFLMDGVSRASAGKKEVKLLTDNWTVVTRDHSLSAQWEHTILVIDDGYEILTLIPGDTL